MVWGASVSRRGRAWSFAEMSFVDLHVGTLTDAQIGAYLGRTPKAVRQWRERNHIAPTRTTARWMTSGEAARMLGVSQQTVTRWCRTKQIPARRVPGGRWWLVDWAWCISRRDDEQSRALAAASIGFDRPQNCDRGYRPVG